MSRLAPMSTPRVGSLRSRTFGSVASQRAMTTFCWLPPRQRRDAVARSPERDPEAVDVVARAARRVAPRSDEPAGGVAAERGKREVLADRHRLEERLGAALARHVGDSARPPRPASESRRPSAVARGRPRPRTRRAPRARAGTHPGRVPRGRRGRRAPRRAARSRSAAASGAAERQSPGGRRRRRAASRRALPAFGEVLRAGHQPHELRGGRLAAVERRDRVAGAHDGDAVADLLDLVHAVRDEDRRRALGREPLAAIANSRSRVATSSAEVASSRIRTFGSRTSARAMQHACRSLKRELLDGPVETAAPRPRSSSSARAARASRFSAARHCVAAQPVGAEPDVVEHRPRPDDEHLLEDGRRCRRRAAPRRGDAREPLRRRRSIVPASGRCTPVRILTSVLLPEPFSPTIAWTSPGRSSNVHERTAWVAPNAFASPTVRRATGDGLGASRQRANTGCSCRRRHAYASPRVPRQCGGTHEACRA